VLGIGLMAMSILTSKRLVAPAIVWPLLLTAYGITAHMAFCRGGHVLPVAGPAIALLGGAVLAWTLRQKLSRFPRWEEESP
jgi:hypothetical protein